MKKIVFFIANAALLVCVYSGVLDETKLIHLRAKRQIDIWSWGYADDTKGGNAAPSTISINTDDADPCSPYTPTMPDFRKSGRRISETKCYEYIWQLKSRAERDKRGAACEAAKNDGKDFFHTTVVGGRNAQTGEFPHMGAIGWKAAVGTWIFKCGSSLISSKFVLTAAHCSQTSTRDTTVADPVPKIVRLGDKNILDISVNGVTPFDVNIVRIIVHPKYASPMKYNDIALMELESEVKFTKSIQPACLLGHSNIENSESQVAVTGWGVTEPAGLLTAPVLQVAFVDIIDTPTCDQLLRPSCNRLWCGVQDHQICAGNKDGGVDACQGDSGGPIQMKIPLPVTNQGSMHYVIGVTSFGIGCARPNTPGIYTRVSSFIDWIEGIVWG